MAKKIKGLVPREGATLAAAPDQLQSIAAPAEPAKPIAGRKVVEVPAAAEDPAPLRAATAESGRMVVVDAELYTPVRFGGKLEKHLTRIDGIEMYWVKGEGLWIILGQRKALIPAAGVHIAHFAL